MSLIAASTVSTNRIAAVSLSLAYPEIAAS